MPAKRAIVQEKMSKEASKSFRVPSSFLVSYTNTQQHSSAGGVTHMSPGHWWWLLQCWNSTQSCMEVLCASSPPDSGGSFPAGCHCSSWQDLADSHPVSTTPLSENAECWSSYPQQSGTRYLTSITLAPEHI